MEQKSPDYLAINPNGLVPTLAHNNRVIYESNVITEYLDAVFPQQPLYPQHAWSLAQVKMWQAFELSLAKDFRPFMYQRLMGPLLRLTHTLTEVLERTKQSTQNPADWEWEKKVWSLQVLTTTEEQQYQQRLLQRLDVLERQLADSLYLVGNNFTQADISVFPRLRMYAFVDLVIDAKQYPRVTAWMQRLEQRSSFRLTMTANDKAIDRLHKIGLLRWIREKMQQPTMQWRWWERNYLRLLRYLFKRVMDKQPQRKAPMLKPSGTALPAVGIKPVQVEPEYKQQPITLYGYQHSPSTQRIKILLQELNITWLDQEIDMAAMQHKTSHFLRLNPNGELPVLQQGTRIIYDSALIAEYVQALYANSANFFSTEAFELAQIRMWLAYDAAMHKEYRPLFYLSVIRQALLSTGLTASELQQQLDASIDSSHRAWFLGALRGQLRIDLTQDYARQALVQRAAYIDQHLKTQNFLVAHRLTFADIALYTRITSFKLLGIDLPADNYPYLHAWLQRLGVRPSFQYS